MKKYHVGFALSGGFIRGIAHLGMLQALFEHNIRPDILSGTSAGAIVSVLLADGRQPFEIMEMFSDRTFTELAKVSPGKESLFKMDYFIDFMRSKLRTRNLEDLNIPVVVTATDFDHGCAVHFTHGEIARRVAASCCIPVLFAPVKIGGTYYVDGGVFMNIPVSPIRELCDKVLALNVYKLVADKYSMNLASIAFRAYHFMFQANTFTELEQADMVIAPDGLDVYSNYELEKAEDIFGTGYFEASKILEGLERSEQERYLSFR